MKTISRKNDAQISDEEMIKVGSKLTGILRKLVFSNLGKNSKVYLVLNV